MEKRILQVAYCVLYVIAITLVAAFAVMAVKTYGWHKEMLLNPLVEVTPYSFIVKRLCVKLLVPAAASGILGYALQKISKKRKKHADGTKKKI